MCACVCVCVCCGERGGGGGVQNGICRKINLPIMQSPARAVMTLGGRPLATHTVFVFGRLRVPDFSIFRPNRPDTQSGSDDGGSSPLAPSPASIPHPHDGELSPRRTPSSPLTNRLSPLPGKPSFLKCPSAPLLCTQFATPLTLSPMDRSSPRDAAPLCDPDSRCKLAALGINPSPKAMPTSGALLEAGSSGCLASPTKLRPVLSGALLGGASMSPVSSPRLANHLPTHTPGHSGRFESPANPSKVQPVTSEVLSTPGTPGGSPGKQRSSPRSPRLAILRHLPSCGNGLKASASTPAGFASPGSASADVKA